MHVSYVTGIAGGTIGDVFVTWSIDAMATNASRETDYVADGATLTFFAGEDVRGNSTHTKYLLLLCLITLIDQEIGQVITLKG